jgi:imidazolonepropionase-like amidohydrolase
MAQREVDAAVEAAHSFGRMVNAHARSAEAIKRALRAGVDVLYHCEYADEEALDMMEAAKDRIFVAPTVSLFHTMLNEAADYGFTHEVSTSMGMAHLLEWSQKTHSELRKRGIRHVIGGDYGFAWSHHGTNARDIGFFSDYFGYTPSEALQCATRNGGALMMMRSDDKLGEVAEGQLADLLVVDGDPVSQPGVLLDRNRLLFIMKDGQVYKNETSAVRHRAAA